MPVEENAVWELPVTRTFIYSSAVADGESVFHKIRLFKGLNKVLEQNYYAGRYVQAPRYY